MTASPRHFTADYVERCVLRDGTAVRLRLLAPEDKHILARGFDRLSASSRYARFMAPKQRLSDDELRYLTEVDQECHVAIGAISEAGTGDGEAVGLGIARFICIAAPDGGPPRIAEAAIAVADSAQHQGLGKLLFVRLIAAAVERGIERFRCEVLADNAGMRELIKSTAPDYTTTMRGGVLTIELALPNITPAAPASATLTSTLYRLFRLAAADVLDWTDAVARLWRRRSARDLPTPPADSEHDDADLS